ncbi:MAG: DUF1963 domain-containing protein [Micromonosporaceae bacterium]|nr:DUF1963 domain-containing protein [Micromonosporaceae bacterium]
MEDFRGMGLADLRAALDGSPPPLPAPVLDTVLSMARPSVQLTAGDGDPRAGTYGGLPALPADLAWPSRDQRPLTLVAQLDCAVLSYLLGPEWTLPKDGRLFFFHDDDLSTDDQAGRVLHVGGDPAVGAAPADAAVIPPIPLVATRCWSVPGMAADELTGSMAGDLLGTLDVLSRMSDVVPYPPHQVLGWLGDDYYPPYPQLRPLLQLAGEQGTAWGECVRIAFLLSEEDLRAARLDRVRVSHEVA